MGCSSASRTWRLHRVVAFKEGRRGGGATSDSQEDANRREQDDTETVPRSPSVRSLVSAVPTLTSHHSSNKYQLNTKRSGLIDDLQSDAPAISESIADMEDLEELNFSPTPSLNQQRLISEGVISPLQTVIDNRQHPFAPFIPVSSTTYSEIPACGDLGAWSDVPSVCDNVSAVSAQSEFFMSLRTSHASGSRCGSSEHDMVSEMPFQQGIADSSGKGGQLWEQTGTAVTPVKQDRSTYPVVLQETQDYAKSGLSGSSPEIQGVTPDAWCLATCDTEKC